MAGNTVKITGQFVDKITSPLGKVIDQFSLLSDKQTRASAIGNIAAMALSKGISLVTQGMGQLVDAGGAAIKSASDLNEQTSKTGVVFGKAAGQVTAFADSAAHSLGLSARAALEAAGTFGNFFLGVGASEKQAADMSQRLVTLAGDLASFNNIDPTVALEKLRSGLAGEAEPLRQVGVFLTEAKVKAKAMELGLADASGTVSEGAKIQARYALILAETKTAQGDFARTSGGLANQQRILTANTENLSASLGKHLLPAAISVVSGLNDLLDGVTDADYSIQKLTDAMEKPKGTGIEHAINALGRLITISGETRAAAKAVSDAHVDLEAAVNSAATRSYDEVEAMREMRDAFGGAREKAVELKTATWSTEESLRALQFNTMKSSGSLEELRKKLDAAAASSSDMARDLDILEGKMFDGAILTGELAQAEKDLDELLKNPPGRKAAISEMQIYAGTVAEAEKRIFDLHYREAQSAGPEAMIRWLEEQDRLQGGINGKNHEYILLLDARARAELALSNRNIGAISKIALEVKTMRLAGLAAGGPVLANTPVIVGEKGPELFVPKTAGTVVPNRTSGGGSWGGGGGPTTIVLQLNGRELGRAVLEELDYRRGRGTFLPA